MGKKASMPCWLQRVASLVVQPEKARTVLLYFLAMAATPMGAFPMMVWPSRRPSPVITMSASLMQDSNLVSSRTIWMPDWRMAFV